MWDKIKYNLYRLRYNHGKNLFLKKPVDVSLELASTCNQHCSYCYHADKKNLGFKQGLMNLTIAEQIIFQSACLGVNSLKFNWKGESTLNPHFKSITNYAKSFASGMTFIDRLTNSNFKFDNSREDIFDGLCNQTKVKVSFDSFNKEIFESQRNGGDWELTYKNIDTFYNYKKRKETDMVIQCVRTQKNKDEDLEGQVKKRWPSATISIRDVVEGRLNKNINTLKVKDRDDSQRRPCDQAFVRILFNHEGKAFPCCPDIRENLLIGDIRTMKLKDIFNSIEAKKLRKDLKSLKAFENNPCKSCSSFETYKGYQSKWIS